MGGKEEKKDKYIVRATEYIYRTCKILVSEVQYSDTKVISSYISMSCNRMNRHITGINPSRPNHGPGLLV